MRVNPLQCVWYCFYKKKITVPITGHGGDRFKKPTVDGYTNPTNPAFRVSWHALMISAKEIVFFYYNATPIRVNTLVKNIKIKLKIIFILF